MVYGRYNELVNGVYKPTNITGGHHPVGSDVFFHPRHNGGLYRKSSQLDIRTNYTPIAKQNA